MKIARGILVPAVSLLMLLLLAFPVAGCLDAIVSSGDGEGGGGVPDLQGELREKIRYVRSNADELAASIHVMINHERKSHGLDPLQWDQSLANIALSHSRDMAERDYFDHVSPEGKDFADRYKEHGYHLETRIGNSVYVGGENLALSNVVSSYTYDEETGEVYEYRYSDLEELASSAVQGWMESQGHRDNILTPFTREGVGVYISDEGKVFVTQNFS